MTRSRLFIKILDRVHRLPPRRGNRLPAVGYPAAPPAGTTGDAAAGRSACEVRAGRSACEVRIVPPGLHPGSGPGLIDFVRPAMAMAKAKTICGPICAKCWKHHWDKDNGGHRVPPRRGNRLPARRNCLPGARRGATVCNRARAGARAFSAAAAAAAALCFAPI